jgi:hypothetical protein
VTQEEVAILGSEVSLKQNKPEGYMCVSCSWAKPAKPRPFEFCENGAKATAWRSRTSWPHWYSLPSTHTGSDHQLEERRVAGTEDLEILGTMFFVADCFGMKDEGGSDGFERQKDRNSRHQWFRAGGT